jgi:hypothetical protein
MTANVLRARALSAEQTPQQRNSLHDYLPTNIYFWYDLVTSKVPALVRPASGLDCPAYYLNLALVFTPSQKGLPELMSLAYADLAAASTFPYNQ